MENYYAFTPHAFGVQMTAIRVRLLKRFASSQSGATR
jgi:hypothetical protein